MRTEALMREELKKDFNRLDMSVKMLQHSLQECEKIRPVRLEIIKGNGVKSMIPRFSPAGGG